MLKKPSQTEVCATDRCLVPPPTAGSVFTLPFNLQPVIPSITSTASRRRNFPPKPKSTPIASTPSNPASTPGPTSSPAKTPPNLKPSPPRTSSTIGPPAQRSSRSLTPSSPPSGSSAASANYRVECLDQNLTHAEFVDESIQHNSPLGHSYQEAIDPFARIHRRIDATNRMYLRTLKVLQDLQAAAPTPVSEPPSPLPAHPFMPPIGFVPPTARESGVYPRLPTSLSGESARRGGADFSLRGLIQHPASLGFVHAPEDVAESRHLAVGPDRDAQEIVHGREGPAHGYTLGRHG